MSCTSFENELDDFPQRTEVTHVVTITDGSGSPIDITGSTLTYMLKINRSDPDPGVLSKTAVLTDPVNGEATFVLSDVDTDIEPRTYLLGIEWENAAGGTKVLVDQTITVEEKVIGA